MIHPPITCLVDSKDRLGEGCFWDSKESAIWWLDVVLPSRIHKLVLATGVHRTWHFSEMVSATAMRGDGTLVVGCEFGVKTFDPNTGALTPVIHPDADMPQNRGNDGACDAAGRFWFGTMQQNIAPDGADLDITQNSGRLFRIGKDFKSNVMESNIGVSNGPCWSPDSKVFYFTDSRAQIIWAYDFDLDAGTISNKRIFNDAKDHGYPDGATVDAEGHLWSARWEGSCVLRLDPRGRLDRVVPMPARRPTCVCFGGPKLDTMFVTTARLHVPKPELERYPLQGGLFCFNPQVKGFEKHQFAG
jgi:L-arabinonolactonase